MLVFLGFFSRPCSVSLVFWLAFRKNLLIFFFSFFFRLRRQTNSKSLSNDSSASQENRPKSRPKPIKPASNYYSISAVQISGIYAYNVIWGYNDKSEQMCVGVCATKGIFHNEYIRIDVIGCSSRERDRDGVCVYKVISWVKAKQILFYRSRLRDCFSAQQSPPI